MVQARLQFLLLGVFLLVLRLVATAAEPAAFSGFSSVPRVLVNGSVCLFTVRVAGSPAPVTGTWQGHELTFTRGSAGFWYALGGVAYDTKPGTYDLELKATMSSGQTASEIRHVAVQAAIYKTSRLTVPQKYVTPDPETLKRIEAEKEVKDVAFAHVLATPQWSGNFTAPVPAELSESYGTSRTFNGKLASFHRGTDFRATTGTPVHASNAGQVVLSRELYYEGNCVVIDHGLGFMTMYMHLSKLDVEEGDHVRKGQIIALSGGTGRATGPHLHMSVRWSGEYLDPMKLLALRLPAQP